jgi:hypothetical protein
MNGIDNGYLNNSPLAALTLAIVIQRIFRIQIAIRMGMPIIMKISGKARTEYSRIDRLKFMAARPLMFTQVESSFFDNQIISGPIIPPKGKKKPAKAAI